MLKTSKDDFINSSYIRDLSPSTPTFIATQAPIPTTMETFWQMIYEQQVFLLVMLVSSKSKVRHTFLPETRIQHHIFGFYDRDLCEEEQHPHTAKNINPTIISLFDIDLCADQFRKFLCHLGDIPVYMSYLGNTCIELCPR